ncbi:PhoX family protein [Flagellimonas lutaonensis]|uniref:Alkaline phosphatase n=1 Tax=Flagellimonas lutaonensis TaxID=516051 RepID=A0A0D5YVJ8_9FLAO|nr:alkaline phosphatase PhoX [Allomuricauda lutaonensis]AKA36260.1 Alkaline phosphatase [Allomuricauda lutaonensis]
MAYNRRKFISFLGKASAGTVIIPPFLAGCGNLATPTEKSLKSNGQALDRLRQLTIEGLSPSNKDDLLLAKGMDYHVIVRWSDKISENDEFGFNNDFTCFIPFDDDNPTDGLLWVNHEYVNPLFVSGFDRHKYENPNAHRTKEQVDQEMYHVGGSIVRIKQTNGRWEIVKNDPHNRRITAKTPIALNWDHPIKGATTVIGTHSNCSGGITPWKTFLSCEENYDSFFGETVYDQDGRPAHRDSSQGWEKFYDYPPEHYGWVVEVDPKDGSAQKHIALGRFAHECCTLYELKDKRVVAYTGDDKNNEHLYKFVSTKPGSLKEGTLYVADTVNGKWLSLDWESQPKLKERFKDQTEVLVRTREAAKILGATELNRPEDIEIDPITGNIFVSLTNNYEKRDFHGSILKIEETDGQYDALTFKASTYMAGGEKNGFSCPDNLAFDMAGNLWITSDMSGSKMNKEDGAYMPFKNNSLFVVPRHGKDEGKVIRLASAPNDAELTGPWFSPDGKTLFLSVQHPGEQTSDLKNPTSTWPFDADGIPKPAVVAITGDLIEKMNKLHLLEKA